MRIIFFFFIVLSFSLSAQNPVVEWAKTFGGSRTEYPFTITVTKNNKYLVAGWTGSSDGNIVNTHGLSDAWLIKLDENGAIIWQKTYGGSGPDGFYAICETLEGGFIMVGTTNSIDGDVTENKGGSDMWIVKIDSIGSIEWQKTYGGTKRESAWSVFQTKNGDYLIGGYSDSSDFDFPQNAGEEDWWVLKLNNRGNMLWKKRIGGSKSDLLGEMVNIDDKTFAIAGDSDSFDGDMVGSKGDISVKMDSSGNILWKKSFGSPFDTLPGLKAFRAATMSKNDIVSVGTMIISQSSNNPQTLPYTWEFLITKSDTAGNRKWSKIFGGTETESAKSVESFPNGDLLVTGLTQSNDGNVQNSNGGIDFWVLRLDSLGNLKNANCYGGSKEDQAYNSVIDKKGNVIVIGFTSSSDGIFTQNRGLTDWAIVKLRYNGTAVKESHIDGTTITEYPNPIQDQFKIQITQKLIPKLTIYDVFGKQMYHVNQLQPETTIDMASYPNGLYILTYQLEGETLSRKVVKMQ